MVKAAKASATGGDAAVEDGVIDVSVVVPVYRCADALPELARRVARALTEAGHRHELILVDDASPDDAAEVARQLAADPAVGYLCLDPNQGQQRALLAGLSAARGAWCVVLDGDLQDPPEAIPALLALGRGGYDCVFAGRRGRYQSFARMLTSRAFKWLQHRLAGVPRDAGLFAALSRRMVVALLSDPDPWPWVVPMIGATGLPLAALPVERRRRSPGGSAYTPAMRLASGLGAVACALRHRRRPNLAGGVEASVDRTACVVEHGGACALVRPVAP